MTPRQAVLKIILEAGRPIDGKEIAEALKKKPGTVRKMLFILKEQGQIKPAKGRGLWELMVTLPGTGEDRPEGLPEGGFLLDDREVDYRIGGYPKWTKKDRQAFRELPGAGNPDDKGKKRPLKEDEEVLDDGGLSIFYQRPKAGLGKTGSSKKSTVKKES